MSAKKSVDFSKYDPSHFMLAGENYIKVCNLILDLVDSNALDELERRQILFPLLYNYKHALELYFKGLLLRAKIQFKMIHDLDKIFNDHKDDLENYFDHLLCSGNCKKHFRHFMNEVIQANDGYFGGIKIFSDKDLLNVYCRFPEVGLNGDYSNLNKIDFNALREQIKRSKLYYTFLFMAENVTIEKFIDKNNK